MKTVEIHWLEIRIRTSTGLLSDYLRKKLNPLEIRLMSVKDIPYKTDPKFKPIYASLEFVDGSTVRTKEMPQQPVCKFDQKFVFLTGHFNQTQVKEWFNTKLIKVYLHDCEEYM